MSKYEKDKQGRIICPKCNNPVHVNDLGAISKKGVYHKTCTIALKGEG